MNNACSELRLVQCELTSLCHQWMGPRVRAWVWQWRRGSCSRRSGSRLPSGGGWDLCDTQVKYGILLQLEIVPLSWAAGGHSSMLEQLKPEPRISFSVTYVYTSIWLSSCSPHTLKPETKMLLSTPASHVVRFLFPWLQDHGDCACWLWEPKEHLWTGRVVSETI